MTGVRGTTLESRHRRAAVVAVLLIAVSTTFVFAKHSLFGGGYEVRAVVSSVSQLRGGSEVRIAGVKVGEVDGIDRGPADTSIVRMTVDDSGRPIRSDATLTVKPRLLLEGNAYIDLSPGTPAASELADGATIPLGHTAISPQLDQVLNVFDSPTRESLHGGIAGLAAGLGGASPAPTSAGGSGSQGLRDAVRELDGALGSVRQVVHAVRGTRPGDLPRAVRRSGDVVAQLAQSPRALADSVTNFNRMMGALADESTSLAASVSGLHRVLQAAPASLTRIDAALPALTRFAGVLRPALRDAPVTLRKTNSLLDQVKAVSRPAELPGLLDRLDPVTSDLPALEQRLKALFGYTTQVMDCISTHVVPVLNTKMQDGTHTTGDPAWLDLLHAVTGFTSASTSFDGNAGTFRAGLAFGPAALQGVIPGLGTIAGRLNPDVQGVRPVWLGYGVEPPYRPDQQCADQPLPNLNAKAGPPPDWNLRRIAAPGGNAK
ncbi:MAG: Long-chain-fatty-acid--CoA ligase [Solirubrobacterales bacterium]|nr:Long-chain-fatty-acid--CoA ligase [Solirubrobacterales bacterium]